MTTEEDHLDERCLINTTQRREQIVALRCPCSQQISFMTQ